MNFSKWMYRGGQPNWLASLLNWLSAAVHALGIAPNYLKRAPGARPHVAVNKDAPLSEFEKVAAKYPVFRVVRRYNE